MGSNGTSGVDNEEALFPHDRESWTLFLGHAGPLVKRGLQPVRRHITAYVLSAACTAASCGTGANQVSMHGADPVIFSHSYHTTHKAAAHTTLTYDPASKCLRVLFNDGTDAVPVWPPVLSQ